MQIRFQKNEKGSVIHTYIDTYLLTTSVNTNPGDENFNRNNKQIF